MLRNRNSSEETILRNFLKTKRIEKGFTQRKLSELIDNSHSFVNKYESGERYLLFTEVILICKLLQIDPHEITEIMDQSFNEPSESTHNIPT